MRVKLSLTFESENGFEKKITDKAIYYRYLGPNRSLTVVSRYNLSFLVKVYPSACLSVVACD